MHRIWNFVTTYSLLLLGGALLALVWANLAPEQYRALVDYIIAEGLPIGAAHDSAGGGTGDGTGGRTLTLHFLVNDILMAFFFAIAAKEVWEAVILKDGPLRGRKAATPLIATLGGMAGPVAVYLGLAALLGSATWEAVAHGWAIPTATDIAFSYLVGVVVFGAAHPAVRFLLLLAIADDAGGLIILAIFYPTGALAPAWLLLSLGAAVAVFVLANWLPRRLDRHRQDRPHSTWTREKLSFWPYALAGAVSWFAFQKAGIHPALGLLPIVPTLPHADRDFGIFDHREAAMPDLLNHVEHLLKAPVQIVLFLFGLTNAGVEFASIGTPTWLVLAGLLLGKPLGIALLGWIAAYPLRLGLPEGMGMRDLFVLGCVAAIGFTVALFVASVAFAPDTMLGTIPVQEAAKMGALLSFAGSVVAVAAGLILRIEKRH
ncbi:MAG: Na+/H+ antiporter NhaA [Rubellimicrobium sp.]|nr:Na+/H+ antiporter NhaA [Rubellimicrobium sp.]